MRLCAISFLLILAALQQSQPNVGAKETSVDRRNTQREQNDEESKAQIKTPELAIEKCTGCSIAIQEPEATYKQANTYDPRHDPLYRAYLVSTIIGVLGALLGIGAIFLQTKATSKSAAAAERSIKLQEDALKQWVNLEHWEVWMDKRRSIFRVRFHVVNPTKLPLDIAMIETSALILGIGAKPFAENFPMREVLAPDNPFVQDICVSLTEEETTKLVDFDEREAINAVVNCRISFIDSTTRHWEQIFERAVIFDKGEFFALKEYDKLSTPLVRQLKNHLREDKPS